ncbi:helix-turn-helix domain-containing protein [Paenibacillus sp. RRE4]|uniref:helix-turn-helix domain-containing protein n=1 Tax=Paenibacillus sp. RRE4 TaxID=2962587 RepID=UPI002882CC91|nr:helix-turn-helix domain-containing protein [Paenibacillus sp. RRE4]MDT0121634.1 helix-turn-helix domain-containing protein [Paenibacillus sp. RRE4]
MVDAVVSHYRQNLELKELAALAGCSVRQLQRRFKQEKRLGPMEYVIQLRMESASRMLRHTDASIGEIAYKLGYRDMYYFSRAFSRELSFPQSLRAGLHYTKLLGTYEYPDLPAVERLAPDLIICTEVHEQYLERLSGIAPVLMFKRNENWQTILSLFGELTGKRAEAKHIIADYLRRTALLSEELATVLAGKSVALIRPLDSLVRVHSAAHRTGAVLYSDLGLPVPLFVADTSDTAYHISVERLPAVQASHYFLLSNGLMQDGISATEQRVLGMLGGGEEQRVHSVDAATWIGSYGPLGINGIVDQVEQALLGVT